MDLLRSWYTPIIAQRFVVTHWVGGWSMSLRRGFTARLVKDKKAAEALIKQLAKNPKDFAKLAREQSIDKLTAAKGGEIGWIVPAQVGQAFASSFIYLTPGSVAQVPIPTGDAWSVVMLSETRKAQNFPKFEDQKSALKAQLEREAAQSKVRELISKAKVEED